MKKQKLKVIMLLAIFLSSLFLLHGALAQTEKINGKTFIKEDLFWTDTQYSETEVIEIIYKSPAYNMFIKHNEEIYKYLSLAPNLKVNINNQNIIISEKYNPPTIQNINNSQNTNQKNTVNNKNFYAWGIIGVLAIFFLAVIVIVIISAIHKKQRDLD